MSKLKALTGSNGAVWIDGEKVGILKKIEAKIIVNREDIQIGLDVDSTMTGIKGEYTLTLSKLTSRWLKYAEKIKNGEDVRIEIIAKLKDPNAKDGAIERYSIADAWFNELPLVSYEVGAPIEEEISGGFPPSKMINLDKID